MTDLKSLIANLRTLASAATPGPYEIWNGNPWHCSAKDFGDVYCRSNGRHDAGYMDQCKKNIAFGAACDPQTVLRLCDVIEKLTEQRDKWIAKAHLYHDPSKTYSEMAAETGWKKICDDELEKPL